jgi:hypothetical protein
LRERVASARVTLLHSDNINKIVAPIPVLVERSRTALCLDLTPMGSIGLIGTSPATAFFSGYGMG